MLVLLTPSQVVNEWKNIKLTVRTVQGGILTDEHEAFLLNGLVQGRIQAWVFKVEDAVLAIVLTTIAGEIGVTTRQLMINGLYSFGGGKDEYYADGLEVLKKYAKDNKCSQIVFYTDNPYLYNKVKEFGTFNEKVMLTLEVPNG